MNFKLVSFLHIYRLRWYRWAFLR